MKKLELAVYGKGGIGKSTVSANLSAALALSGKRVMQIGCDPKHDSTRLLMHGQVIPTVLEYVRDTAKETASLDAVLCTGYAGIGCIEAGGPKPGVGCAGRGIISAFEFLKEHHAKDAYDLIVYDVLGDVVCGGFAVPVRREYANAIFLVTSGEYMALYAANNILRGIRNYDGDTWKRVAGIIYNERKVTDEDGRVRRFAEAVGLPVCAKIPRSNAFARAEEENRPLMELEGYETEKEIFRRLAAGISREMLLYRAQPLTDEELERVVLGTVPMSGNSDFGTPGERRLQYETDPTLCGSKAIDCGAEVFHEGETADREESRRRIPERLPLYGCAFNGAATAAVHLTDALVLAHAPKACAFYTMQNITSPGRKNLFNRGVLMPSAINPHFACTEMGQTETVFGGMDKLKACVRDAMEQKPGAVVVVSACVSGIIGDDIRQTELMSTQDCPVIAVHADGDVAGDYMEGIRLLMHALAERLIDPTVQPEGRSVNLVNETGVSNNRDANFQVVRELLGEMGISINCRFLGDATVEEVRNFRRAPLNLLAADSVEGRNLQNWLTQRYGSVFLDEAFPVGFQATERWLYRLGEYFDCMEEARRLVQEKRQSWQEQIEELKPALAGKRVFLTTINSNIDWLLDTADAIGMNMVKIGVANYLRQPVKVTDHPERYCIDENLDWRTVGKQIEEAHPDLVLSNYTTAVRGNFISDSTPMMPPVGFFSGVQQARRWAGLFQTRREGAWRNDRALFETYYA